MFLKLAVVMVVSWSCEARLSRPATLRVFKGETASHSEFSFIVMTQMQKPPFRRQCTGSLIAETWVLTAAHCCDVVVKAESESIVRYGDFILPANETKLYSKIIRAFVPTSFQITNQLFLNQTAMILRDDIGLLLIERIPNKPTAKLLALDYRTLSGLPVKYAGFGFTHNTHYAPLTPINYKQLSSIPLHVGEGVLLPCDNFKDVGPIICVEPKCSSRAQGARPSDSGGPLAYDGRIIGVVKGPSSWTLKAKTGTCFTPVSMYMEWIKQVMAAQS